MINKNDNPVEWTLLLDELAEAKEHLAALIDELDANRIPDDTELAVHVGHIYAHLNRFWNTRNSPQAIRNGNWQAISRFPADLEPVG